jgi:hypothetical protein
MCGFFIQEEDNITVMSRRRVMVLILLGVLAVGAVAGSGTIGNTVGGETQNRGDPSHTFGTSEVDFRQLGETGEIDYEFTGPFEHRFIVDGYRSGHLGPFPDVRVGETLRIPVRVTNRGNMTESYELPLIVDGEEVDLKSGELAPGEETVVEPSVQFNTVDNGFSTVEMRNWNRTILIYDRNSMVLTDLEVSETTVETGEKVTVTATIENGGSNSVETVEILNYADVIHTETVSLEAGESTTLETTYVIEDIIGALFSVRGDFVTGSHKRVTTPDMGFNGTDWMIDLNETDVEFNDTEFNETDVEFNDTEFNETDVEFNDTEFNETDVEFNDTDFKTDLDEEADDSDEDGSGFSSLVAIAAVLLLSLVLPRRDTDTRDR